MPPKSKAFLSRNRLSLSSTKDWSGDFDRRKEARAETKASQLEAAVRTAGWVTINPHELVWYVEEEVRAVLRLNKDSTWSGKVRGRSLVGTGGLPDKVDTDIRLRAVLEYLKTCTICPGDGGDFIQLDMSRSDGYRDEDVIRHNSCPVVLAPAVKKCQPCTRFRHSLRKRSNRAKVEGRRSNVPIPQVAPTLQACPIPQVPGYRPVVPRPQLAAPNSPEAGRPTDTHLEPPETFPARAKLLWREQELAWERGQGHRWNTMILRWALTLRKKSTSSYNYLRASGFLTLPCDGTLRSYIPYDQATPGMDRQAARDLAEQLRAKGLPTDVSLVYDEMKVKEGLVYEKASGKLTGFVELDEVGEARLGSKREHASHMICFVVRPVRDRDAVPIAHFATHGLTGDQLYHMFWSVVSMLEVCGLHVRIAIGDGASANRRFVDLHKEHFPDDDVTYRAVNMYSADGRTLYFGSDVPHLQKTTRNCYENSYWNKKSRTLTLHKKEIRWRHVVDVFDDMATHNGFVRVHKLTKEHVKLTAFSRMRVNLAVQVLSQSVANAMRQKNDGQLSSTIEFTEKFNNAFDALNVRYHLEGARNRSKWLSPYTHLDDWRFDLGFYYSLDIFNEIIRNATELPTYQWLEQEFLGWLDNWKQEVEAIPNLTRDERSKCQLSHQTTTGWRMTCSAFIALTRELLAEGYNYVLSEKLLCQDAVENYFAAQRHSGGSCNQPTASAYMNSAVVMKTCRRVAVPVVNGNCRGNTAHVNHDIDETPMKLYRRARRSLPEA